MGGVAWSKPAAPEMALETTAFLTGKLSPEIRIMIYKHLFGPCNHAKPIGSIRASRNYRGAQDTVEPLEPIDSSIFAVNRLLHDEALEAFYNNKTIRLTFEQLQSLLNQPDAADFIRKIEITYCIDVRPTLIHQTLRAVQRLPRIESIAILSEYLAQTGPQDRHIAVPEFAKIFQLGEAVCTDIGRYKLLGTFSKVQFYHSKILKLWPSVASTPDNFDALEEAERLCFQEWKISGPASNLMQWASHSSLRIWVGLWEHLLGYSDVQGFTAAWNYLELQDMVNIGSWRTACAACPLVDVHKLAASSGDFVSIHELGPEHDPRLLQLVTETLSMNIATYRHRGHPSAHGSVDTLKKPQWVQLGEPSEGVEEADVQHKVREYMQKEWFIHSPVSDESSVDREDVRDDLQDWGTFTTIFGEEEINTAVKDDLRRMFYLTLATGLFGEVWEEGDEDDPLSLANWSRRLLQHYVNQVLPGWTEANQELGLGYLRSVFNLATSMIMTAMKDKSARMMVEEDARRVRESWTSQLDPPAILSSKATGAVESGETEAQSPRPAESGHPELDENIYIPFLAKYADHLLVAVRTGPDIAEALSSGIQTPEVEA